MKIILILILLLILLPFLVKSVIMIYLIYKHYFISAANSKYPISFPGLFKILHGSKNQDQLLNGRKPIGFAGTFFTEQHSAIPETAKTDNKKR